MLWLLLLLSAAFNIVLLRLLNKPSHFDVWVATELERCVGSHKDAAGLEILPDNTLIVVMKDGREFYISLIIEEKKETP